MHSGGSPSLKGRIVGPYRLLSSLGKGGMGEVYLAERVDRQYEKKVAIKVSFQAMSSEAAEQRFQRERQALANLDHPNIVRLMDGGATDDDIPYIVMDYVEGLPLPAYCRQQKPSIRQRLELFRKICAAVHYAHQNLIVHRDIKPNNIVVTADGEPKLLDFGIAKMLKMEDAGELTAVGQSPMTLRYAAPEQIEGRAVTVSTDVYCLGVLLHFLLSGGVPHYSPDLSDMALSHRILSGAIPKASETAALGSASHDAENGDPLEGLDRAAVSRELVGDLDNIIALALRKIPTERYASAEHFSEDIRRYLEGLPVAASQGNLQYRMRKFVHRHRGEVIGGAVALSLIIAGLAGVIWQGRVAERERRKAEQRFQEVHELAGSFLFDFHKAIENTPGTSAAQLLVMNKASEYLSRLSKDAAGNDRLQVDLVNAYRRLGDLQGSQYSANAGSGDASLASFRKAVELGEPLRRKGGKDAMTAVAAARRSLGEALMRRSRTRDALVEVRQAADILETLHNGAPKDDGIAFEYMRVLNTMGDLQGSSAFQSLRDFPAALATYAKAIKVGESQAGNPRFATQPYTLRMKVADVEDWIGEPRKALESYRIARAFFAARTAKDPTDLYAKRMTANLDTRMANSLNKLQDYPQSVASLASGARIFEELAASDPNDRRAKSDLVYVYRLTGSTYRRANQPQQSKLYVEKALGIAEQLAKSNPDDDLNSLDIAELSVRLGNLLASMGNLAAARAPLQRGLSVYRRLADAPQSGAVASRDYAEALMDAQVPELRDPPLALRYIERSLGKLNAPPSAYDLRFYGRAQCQAGQRENGVASLEKGRLLVQNDPGSAREREEIARELAACRAAAPR